LATPKDPVSTYGDFHVFLLRMLWTKRHLKLILLKRIYKCWVEEKFGNQNFWLMSPPSRFIQPVPSFISHSDTLPGSDGIDWWF
jgi:hypothetical protein